MAYELTSNIIDMYGITEAFQVLMASMISDGRRLVLVGDPGSGKTELIKRIGVLFNEALGVDLFMADATTFDPDEHIGVSLPIVENETTKLSAHVNAFLGGFSGAKKDNTLAKQLYEGVRAIKACQYNKKTYVTRVPNDSKFLTASIVAIDEISRANLRAMNALLQLYSNNKVDGQPLAAMFKFAMMNDPSHAGSEELSSALAERFAMVYNMPHAGDMSRENRYMATVGKHNSGDFWVEEERSEKDWRPSDLKKRGEFLVKRLTDIRKSYLKIKETHSEVVVQYVDSLCIALEKEGDTKIEFRRRQFLYDNIMALYAVLSDIGQPDMAQAASRAIRISFPGWLYGEGISNEHLLSAHEVAVRFLVSPEDRVILELLNIQRTNPFTAAAMAISKKVGLANISKFINFAVTTDSEDVKTRKAFAVALLSMKNLKIQANDRRLLAHAVGNNIFRVMEV